MTKRILLLVLISGLTLSCSKKDNNSSNTFQLLPSIGAAVDKAKPTGIQASALQIMARSENSLSPLATSAEAAEALRDFFTDNVGTISGYTIPGYIDAYIYDMDKRIEEIQVGEEPTCLSSTATTVTFATGITNHTIDLKLQCIRNFGGAGDQSGSGSGLAYGRDENYYYIYLILVQANNTNDKFGYAAKVHRTTEAVELIFLESFPTYSRTMFFHLLTQPDPKQIEFAVASTSGGVGPASTQTANSVCPGMRFISNASYLRAEGSVSQLTDSSGNATGTSGSFDNTECFDATNLATTPATCTGSAPTFNSTMPLTLATALPAVNSTISSNLKTMTELSALGIQSN
jgi:hypothetical protein